MEYAVLPLNLQLGEVKAAELYECIYSFFSIFYYLPAGMLVLKDETFSLVNENT